MMAIAVMARTAPGGVRAINHTDHPALNKRASQQRWVLLGMWAENQTVSEIDPFPELQLELGRWWLPGLT